tara:strand:- start:32257 stop:33603 length:1347 start_codon:yes stop_codon:yes gene_type:complete
MITSIKIERLKSTLEEIKGLKILSTISDRERFSRDFFDYSPVLKAKLNTCIADLIVRPGSVDAVVAVARACQKTNIPLTLRGSGTGNYGQCVPLKGGVVMLMSDLKEIREIDDETGVVIVETGCLLRDLNSKLSDKGRQLRLLPSTWRSASVGGFIAGGSGGIGSVRWGFLRDPGHLLGIEMISIEGSPQLIQLNEKEAEALNHAYGTNGIITALKLSTTHLVNWQEVAIDCKDWQSAVELVHQCSRAAIDVYLCSLLENKIVECLPTWSGEYNAKHRILLLVSPDGLSTLKQLAMTSGAFFNHLGPENEKRGAGIRELSWNHTTLHMRALDSNWTYLQMLLPQPELEAMQLLKRKWGDDLLWHLEGVRQQGNQRFAALPLIKWKGIERLEELITDCREIGAIIFNPHVISVEDGGLGVIDVDQVEAKRRYDPQGILNPGKLKGWPDN